MKTLSFILMLMSCIVFQNTLQAQAPWNKVYNFNPNPAFFNSIAFTHLAEDSFILSAGNSYSIYTGGYEGFVGKLDYLGNAINYKTFRNGYGTWVMPGQNLVKVSNDKYVLSGAYNDYYSFPQATMNQPFLYFFNKNLDSLKYIADIDTYSIRRPYSIAVDNYKNIIACGSILSDRYWSPYSSSYSYHFSSAWLAKYDSNGHKIWNKSYLQNQFPVNASTATKVLALPDDSGYLIAGISSGIPFDTLNSFIAKVDTAGNLLWSKKINNTYKVSWGEYNRETFIDITPLRNGNYAFTTNYSDTAIAAADSQPYWPYKPSSSKVAYGVFDDTGKIIWCKSWTYPDIVMRGQYVAEALNGDLIIACQYGNTYMSTPALFRTTPNGEIKNYREYNYTTIDTPVTEQYYHFMSLTPDDRVLISGYLNSQGTHPALFDSSGAFSWHMLTDTNGCLIAGCQSIDTMWHTSVQNINSVASDISIYPNPTSDVINIKCATPLNGSLRIVDINGRTAYRQLISGNLNIINIQNIPPGLYIIEITDHNGLLKREKLQKY